MIKTFPITNKDRAQALTEAFRRNPPKMRFTKGMAQAARQLDAHEGACQDGGDADECGLKVARTAETCDFTDPLDGPFITERAVEAGGGKC